MVALEIIKGVFEPVWHFFTDLEVPGLGISFASWFIALLLISFMVQLIRHVFGLGGSGTGYRSGDSSRKYISDRRKGDEF